MNNPFVKKYAQEILDEKAPLARLYFNASYLEEYYKWEIWRFLEKIGVVHPPGDEEIYRLQDIEFDYYDNSIELIDCEDGFTLTSSQYQAIKDLGFNIIFVNYKNGPHLYGNKTASMNAMPVIKDE